MGTSMLFQVPGSLFDVAHLLKYMELGKCCLPGPAAFFENLSRGARRLTARCETTPVRRHLRIGKMTGLASTNGSRAI